MIANLVQIITISLGSMILIIIVNGVTIVVFMGFINTRTRVYETYNELVNGVYEN